MNKQPEITEKTRKVFIDVFCDLYCQKPIEKISVQEIANKSGYNRSTFYQCFTDIYELLAYIENDVLNYLKEELKNVKATPNVQNIVLLFEQKGAYLNALLGDYGNIRFIERLKQELPIDKLCLNFPTESTITQYLIEFHLSTSLSLFRLWLRRQKDLSPEELFKLVDGLYTKGIASISKELYGFV
jgi:AcrR family transcriptional regulator